MENKITLQSVAVRSLGLPPEAAAQIGAIAQREESPDLDTENEFRAAADYLKRLQNQIRTAAEKAVAVPAPSEGTTVFASDFAGEKQGEQIFQYYIVQERESLSHLGAINRFIEGTFNFATYYAGYSMLNLNEECLGRAIKLAGNGKQVFAMVENLTENEVSDYVAIRLEEYGGLVGSHSFAIAQIDSPEFADADGENKIENLLLEDLTVVDGKVCGLYWDRETHSYLELPLKTEDPEGYLFVPPGI